MDGRPVTAACALVASAQPDTLLLRMGLTGAVSSFAALFSPWADGLGLAS